VTDTATAPSGAREPREPSALLDPADLVLPATEDPVVAGAVGAVGGPLGSHARLGRRFWTPVRVLVALVLLTCGLAFVQKAPCLTTAWEHNHQYTRACYNDPYPLYGSEGLAAGQRPYLDHPVEYPVLIGGLMELAAKAVLPFAPDDRAARFFEVTALLMTACAVVTVVATARTHRRRPWDAALFALAPGLLLSAFNNWDLAAAALVALGLLAWSRRHPAWAGVALGLGAATKLYPALLLVPLVLLALRAGRLKEAAGAVGTALLAWAVVDVPIAHLAPTGWERFYVFSQQRGADWGSLWYLLQVVRGPLDTGLAEGADPVRLNRAAEVVFLVLLLGITALVVRAPRRPRVPQVMLLVLVAFMISNKVFSPQYVIWVLPLAALARPRWGAFLLWQATEVVSYIAIWYYLISVVSPGQGIGSGAYFTALLARDAALLLLCAFVVRDVLQPEHDAVRADGSDDPAGGVLDGAPDWPPLAALWGRPHERREPVVLHTKR
jgi:uncharacterized membrane protein